MTQRRILTVPEGVDGQRVDAAVSRLLGFSRTAAAALIAQGRVRIDDAVAAKSDRVRTGALLEVGMPAAAAPAAVVAPEPVPGLRIVHEDDDLVVVDKPAGVAAHPSLNWEGPDVLAGLAAAGIQIATSGAAERQGIVSRLDVGTSGLMVVAKSEYAYSRLKQLFRSRQVDKTYHALVQGLPDPMVGTIDAPIGRRPGAEFKFAVMDSGKPSVTHYEVIEAFRRAALLEVHLETGRTHQIRVHLAALRHPCCGDTMYGADPVLAKRLRLDRQWLHATGLAFEHPGTGRRVEFTSVYPDDLAAALDLLDA